MATTADIRNGLMIKFNNDIYSIVEFLHVKPGKGAAFVRTKLKSMTTGKVLEHTFPSGTKLDDVRVERRKFQYLYPDGSDFVFMNAETFEQITVASHKIENSQFLMEGAECEIIINTDDDQILAVYLPTVVIMEVTYSEPGIKGDTATNTLKPATVNDVAEVRVPLFVNVGDKIKINTSTGEYVERVK
jgi:elongation factor P